MKEELHLRTEDHPEANGRKPRVGEQAYGLRFPLEDGRELVLSVGQSGFDTLTNLLFDMLSEAPSHNDGSTNLPMNTTPPKSSESLPTRGLPQYQCHKKVWALKIKEVNLHDPTGSEPPLEFAGGHLFFEKEGYSPMPFDAEFYRKHKPEAGCYWVQYEDGYTSISPAAVFEAGYTLTDHRLLNALHGNEKRKSMLWARVRGLVHAAPFCPYTVEDLLRMYQPYLEEFSTEGMEPREVRLLETLLSKL